MRKSFQRHGLVSYVATLTIAVAAAASADAAFVNWLGGSSLRGSATNWRSNPLLPSLADDVVINIAGAQTVTHRSGTNAINSPAILGDCILEIGGAL